MLMTLLAGLALADGLVIDARVPVEVHLNGIPVAELFYPCRLEIAADPGEAKLTVFVAGRPQAVTMEIPAQGRGLLVVGRTGVTTGQTGAELPDSDKPATMQVRVTGREPLRLTVDGERTNLNPGQIVDLSVVTGEHKIELSNIDGTIRYAQGLLQVGGGDHIVLQLSEGRMPEVVSDASHFIPTRR